MEIRFFALASLGLKSKIMKRGKSRTIGFTIIESLQFIVRFSQLWSPSERCFVIIGIGVNKFASELISIRPAYSQVGRTSLTENP